MQDGYGRTIDYIRVSVTDRCNLRCVYCMPEEGVEKLSHCDILSYEEMLRICRVLAGMGVRKVKITGGEPLVRRGAASFVRALKEIPGIECVTMTTNGILFADHARELAEAGLDAVNISLDTLDPEQYRRITRTGDVHKALDGLDAALANGIPAKVNCVPAQELNGRDIAEVAGLARDRRIQVRFIELMPMGMGAKYTGILSEQVRAVLESAYGKMRRYTKKLGNGPAEYYEIDGFQGKIGFISAMGGCFCEECNRIRLTADGVLKTCLHADCGTDLKDVLLAGDDGALRGELLRAVGAKPRKHEFAGLVGIEQRIMSQIGG